MSYRLGLGGLKLHRTARASRALALPVAAAVLLVQASACVSPGRVVQMDGRLDSLRTANLALTVEKNLLADSLASIDYAVSGEMDRDIRRFQNQIDKLTYDLQSCREGGELVARLLVDELFEPASARLTPAGQLEIDELIAGFLTDDTRHIVVVGHADTSPPGASLEKIYPTNWELSAARAAAVVRHMISSGGIDAKSVSVVSHGDAHPEYSNGTPDGRKRNRRIEILRR